VRRVAIIGAGGQDGRLLDDLLRRHGDTVTGIRRGELDLSDPSPVRALVSRGFDEIYYLAAHHHSSQERTNDRSADLCRLSLETHVTGATHFLEALRESSAPARFLYAGSSLMFGPDAGGQADETTPLSPACVYGITKTAGFQLCKFYRAEFGVPASGVILFNHESHLRAAKFVVPKIIDAALAASRGSLRSLELGNLEARVDWGYAPDYVEAMTRILRSTPPDDFVLATGQTRSVAELLDAAFGLVGVDWRGKVTEAPGRLSRQRSALSGDARKLERATGWRPACSFPEMIRLIMEARREN